MKTLYIVRHAKSGWDDPLLDDFSRPLNERGKRDAPRMAKRLKEKRIMPDLMLASPARRAKSTCNRMAEVFGYEDDKIKTERDLYNANENKILKVVRSVKDKYETVMIFGHNPGLTAFVNALGNQHFDNVPTCGVAGFEINIDSWKELKYGSANLLFYDFPKRKRSNPALSRPHPKPFSGGEGLGKPRKSLSPGEGFRVRHIIEVDNVGIII